MRRITACFDEHGRSDGQGQAQAEVKQDDSAQAQTESHGRPESANASAPGQTKKAEAAAPVDTGSSVSAGAGVKPTSTTAHGPHRTHCTTGGTTGAATCSPVGADAVSAASVQGDVSKEVRQLRDGGADRREARRRRRDPFRSRQQPTAQGQCVRRAREPVRRRGRACGADLRRVRVRRHAAVRARAGLDRRLDAVERCGSVFDAVLDVRKRRGSQLGG
jgi:hypothetical protein